MERKTLLLLIYALAILCLPGCGGGDDDDNDSPPQLSQTSRNIAFWSGQTALFSAHYLRLGPAPTLLAGQVSAQLRYTITNLTDTGYQVNYIATTTSQNVGSTTVTISPGGNVYPKTVTLNANLVSPPVNIGGTAPVVVTLTGQLMVSYSGPETPVTATGTLTHGFGTANTVTDTYNLQFISGVGSGDITSRYQNNSLALTAVTLQAGGRFTANFASSLGGFDGSILVNSDTSGEMDAVDPQYGRVKVVWDAFGNGTVTYVDLAIEYALYYYYWDWYYWWYWYWPYWYIV